MFYIFKPHHSSSQDWVKKTEDRAKGLQTQHEKNNNLFHYYNNLLLIISASHYTFRPPGVIFSTLVNIYKVVHLLASSITCHYQKGSSATFANILYTILKVICNKTAKNTILKKWFFPHTKWFASGLPCKTVYN